MAVFRLERTQDYTVMSNHHLRDKSLSLKAKGLLSQMLSLPEDWDYTLSGLAYINRESKDAIRSAINELERAGYVQRHQTTDAGGKFSVNEYIIYERPVSANPSPEKPSSDNPTPDKPLQDNPTQLNTKKSNTEKQSTDMTVCFSDLQNRAAAASLQRFLNTNLCSRGLGQRLNKQKPDISGTMEMSGFRICIYRCIACPYMLILKITQDRINSPKFSANFQKALQLGCFTRCYPFQQRFNLIE